jgi:hypothetical protein
MNKETIYQIMNGDISLDSVKLPEELQIEDEFAEGKDCSRLYSGVYEAKQRLLKRLEEREDEDIETILRNMEAISEILALKMYDYGLIGGMLGVRQ